MHQTHRWQDISFVPKGVGRSFDLWFISPSRPQGYRVPNCFWSKAEQRFMSHDHFTGEKAHAARHQNSVATHFMIVQAPY